MSLKHNFPYQNWNVQTDLSKSTCSFLASAPNFLSPLLWKRPEDRDDERLINNKDFVHFFGGRGGSRWADIIWWHKWQIVGSNGDFLRDFRAADFHIFLTKPKNVFLISCPICFVLKTSWQKKTLFCLWISTFWVHQILWIWSWLCFQKYCWGD